ncbi:MAG: autotransporter-associated beta strand repeat-containing protein, partial [Akkermansia sp.]
MKLRLPSQLYSLLMSAFVSLTLATGVSSAIDGFSINFCKDDNGKLSGTDLAGVIPTKADNWTNISAPSGTPTNLKSNEGTLLTGVSVLSSSTNHHFGSGAAGGNGTLLTGFIDDLGSNTPYTVTIAGSPYLVSTVYLIMAGDGTDYQGHEGSKFTAMSVNGVSYTGNGATTSVGTGVWGDRNPGQSSLSEGTNYLQVNDIVGSQIVIQNIANAGGRGTIAGIQVVDAYKGTKHDLTLTANGSWKGVGPVAWSPAWVDSTATNGTYASITSKVVGGAILTIGTSDSVTTDAVVLTGDSTSDLTISGGTLNLINLGILKVDSADRTLTINSTLSGTAAIDGLGTLALGATTLTVGDAQNRAFLGTLKGTAESRLVKTGTGKQSIAKLDLTTYLGTIDVQSGTLEIGTKFNTFTTTKVTTSNNGIFALNMTNDGDDGATATSIINLGDAFNGNLAINSGVFAINNKDEAKGANIGTGKLHLKDGTTFLIRYGITDGRDVFSNDILLSGGTINLRAYGSVNATISSNIKGEGLVSGAWNALRKYDGGTISLTGTIDYNGIFNSEAGITNFTSSTKLQGLFIGSSTVNLDKGSHMTVERLRFSEGGGANSVFNVKEGAVLDVTGTINDHSQNSTLALSHWAGTSKFNVLGGTVNALGAIMYTAWDGTATVQVSGGTLNVMGIHFWARGNEAFRGFVFLGTNEAGSESNEAATGRLNVGWAGIADLKTDARLVLGHGTMGALADWATTTRADHVNKISVLSKLGTTFDTQDITTPTRGYTITLNNDLTGAGKIIKTGEGTLVLNGSESDFSGGTDINGGTVKASALKSLGSGLITLNGDRMGSKATLDIAVAKFEKNITVEKDKFGFLSGTGVTTYAGALTVNGNLMIQGATASAKSLTLGASGALDLGGINTAETLTLTGPLALSGSASSILMDVGATTADKIVCTDVSIGAGSSVTIDLNIVGALANTPYTLIQTSGVTVFDANLLKLNILNRGAKANLSVNAQNDLIVNITDLGGAGTLTWDGMVGSSPVWETGGSSTSWSGEIDKHFFNLDKVIFGDSGSRTVTIAGEVAPSSITITGKDYVFAGAGSIAGNGAMTVNIADANGQATINTSNIKYSGKLTLTSGNLILGAANAAGSGEISFNGGTLYLAKDNVVNGNVLSATAGHTVNLGVASGGNYALGSSNLANLALNKVGDGSLILTPTTNFTQAITITAGTLEINKATGSVSMAGALAGAGKLIKSGAGTLIINSSSLAAGVSSLSGDTVVKAGTLQLGSNGIDQNATVALGTGSINVNNGAKLTIWFNQFAKNVAGPILSNKLIMGDSNSSTTELYLQDGSFALAKGMDVKGNLNINCQYSGCWITLNGALNGGDASSVINMGQATESHTRTNCLTLNVAGDYQGTFIINGGKDGNSTTSTKQILVLGNELAAQNATVNLQGVAEKGAAQLELKQNAIIAGLKGNANSLVFGTAAGGVDTLTVNNAKDNVYDGKLGTNLNLTKSGAGTLTLNGDSSTYVGTTTITGGSLKVANLTATGTGSINIEGATAISKATLDVAVADFAKAITITQDKFGTLAGANVGTYKGALTVNGKFSMGTNATATSIAAGSLTTGATSTLNFDVTSTTSYDKITL